MIKKLSFLILTILISASAIHAQVNWEVGMEWEYEVFGFVDPGFDKTKFTLSKDTIVDGENCFILESETTSCTWRPLRDIVYQDEHSIYYYHRQDSTFQLLYDFGAEVGDTIEVRLWQGHNNNADYIYFLVDTIEMIEYSNQMLKKFTSKVGVFDDGEYIFYDFYYDIIEGIGCTTNLFYFFDNGYCDGLYVENIICFNHPSLGGYVVNPKLCDLSTSINDQLLIKPEVVIFPNPSIDQIFIESDLFYSKMIIFDVSGRQIFKDEFSDEIDVSHYDAGIYFVKLISNQEHCITSFIIE